MKRCISVLVTLFVTLSFGYAAGYPWMVGKWISISTCYEITESSITVRENGDVLWQGEYSLGSDNQLLINGNPTPDPLLADAGKHVIRHYRSSYPLVKWDTFQLPESLRWLIGKWTDGSSYLEFTPDNKVMSLSGQGRVVNKGLFVIEDEDDISVYWEKEYGDSFVLLSNRIAYEGGDVLTKVVDAPKKIMSSKAEKDTQSPVEHFSKNARKYDKSIRWAYGLWKLPDGSLRPRIRITPHYYQAVGELDKYLENLDDKDIPKTRYEPIEEDNRFLGTVVKVGEFYLDPISKLVYRVDGLDKRQYLEKQGKYVPLALSISLWLLAGLVGIALIVFLVIWSIRFIKRGIPFVREWGQKTSKKIIEQSNKTKDNTRRFNDNARRTIQSLNQSSIICRLKEVFSSRENKKLWWYIGGVAVVVCLSVFLFGGSEDAPTSSPTIESSSKEDYRWIYGTWEAYMGSVRDEITITEYTITEASIYGYDTGSYRIEGNELKIKYSNMPQGMVETLQLDPRTHTITSDGVRYRKL